MTNVSFPFEVPENFGAVRDIAERAGIELKGDDGQPWCCDRRMQVKGGLWGSDYARCNLCHKRMFNMASPHINGGYLLNEETLIAYGEAMWTWREGADNG